MYSRGVMAPGLLQNRRLLMLFAPTPYSAPPGPLAVSPSGDGGGRPQGLS